MEINVSTQPMNGAPSSDALTVLAEAGLAAHDLGDVSPTYTAQASGPIGLAGLGALEVLGSAGLVRSVAVVPRHRGAGLGGRLVTALIDQATALGLDAVYLLTEDAAGYFEQRGFATVGREEAPGEIRSTSQFSHLCPESAILMRRSLS